MPFHVTVSNSFTSQYLTLLIYKVKAVSRHSVKIRDVSVNVKIWKSGRKDKRVRLCVCMGVCLWDVEGRLAQLRGQPGGIRESKHSEISSLQFVESPYCIWTNVHQKQSIFFSTRMNAIYLGSVGGKILEGISREGTECLITGCHD